MFFLEYTHSVNPYTHFSHIYSIQSLMPALGGSELLVSVDVQEEEG